MIASILETEIAYTKLFSQSSEDDTLIRFWDDDIPDMYVHNYIFVKQDTVRLADILKEEITLRQSQQKDFLRVEMSFDFDHAVLDALPVRPVVTLYDYMAIQTDRYRSIHGNEQGRVVCAEHEDILADGIAVDVLANEAEMGLDFAVRRMHRKSMVYQARDLPLDLYVCYDHMQAVGKCEMMLHHNIAKIEEFDILPDYQRQGFGSTVIRELLKKASEQKIEQAYLQTDSSDTAKYMYAKCGFEKVGMKTVLFFSLGGKG